MRHSRLYCTSTKHESEVGLSQHVSTQNLFALLACAVTDPKGKGDTLGEVLMIQGSVGLLQRVREGE